MIHPTAYNKFSNMGPWIVIFCHWKMVKHFFLHEIWNWLPNWPYFI